jgi:hypothetical protein
LAAFGASFESKVTIDVFNDGLYDLIVLQRAVAWLTAKALAFALDALLG